MGVNIFSPSKQQIPSKQSIHEQHHNILLKEASCSLDYKISDFMTNPESKPLTKQSYQTVPNINMSDDEEPFTNKTERVAESYKRKYEYAVLTSGILFMFLVASAAFNNKNSGKSFASHLKTSHVVPMEGSADCEIYGLSSTWESDGSEVQRVFFNNFNYVGAAFSEDGTCHDINSGNFYTYTLTAGEVTKVEYRGHEITVDDTFDYGYVQLLVDSKVFAESYYCTPMDLLCAVLLYNDPAIN